MMTTRYNHIIPPTFIFYIQWLCLTHTLLLKRRRKPTVTMGLDLCWEDDGWPFPVLEYAKCEAILCVIAINLCLDVFLFWFWGAPFYSIGGSRSTLCRTSPIPCPWTPTFFFLGCQQEIPNLHAISIQEAVLQFLVLQEPLIRPL